MKYLIFISILFPFFGNTQDLYIKNTSLKITEGVTMSVQNSVVNRGQISNDGALTVKGNWVNAGAYTDQAGQIIFDGIDLQYISHGSLPIGKVIFQNGRKHISESFHVAGKMVMSGTMVFVPAGSGLYLGEQTQLEYERDDRIIGALYMTGNDITFPIGTPEKSLPIRMVLPEGQVMQIGVAAKSGLLSKAKETTISSVADYYWELVTPENYQGAEVTLNFQGARFLQSIENARVGEAESFNSVIKDAGCLMFSGSPDMGMVTSERARGPYLTVARKYIKGEKPPINVLNLVSPNNDGFNDFLLIENIEAYPENTVSIFDRWGVKLYEANAYDNNKVKFEGLGNEKIKSDLAQGSYYYVISLGKETLSTGFFELVR